MNGKEKILLDRVTYALLGTVLLAVLALLFHVLSRDASFVAGVDPTEAAKHDPTVGCITSVEEPEDTFELVRLTFGGTCTPASMLGSDSYGTFNQYYKEKGAAYFLENLRPTFEKDHLTVLGCNAVFSDSETLTMAENAATEWYRAPASMTDVFSVGGVEALSLACRRTRDYGATGYADTKASLEAEGLLWGDGGKALYVPTAYGVELAIGFFIYTDDSLMEILSWIETVKAKYDLVVLYLTDGENSYQVSPDKQNAYRSMVDAGARLVVGVSNGKLQPTEQYGDGYIAYSLGSLMDGSSKYPEKYAGLLDVWIKVNGGKITELDCALLPCRTYDEQNPWKPFLLTDGEEYRAVQSFLYGHSESPEE